MSEQQEPVTVEREAPVAGVVTKLTPRVRRIVAPNPSAFTFTGTCSYILGAGEVAVIDPGPDSDAHLAALLAATAGERIAHIVVTHTHRDHSGLSQRLQAATGAQLVGARAHVFHPGPEKGLDGSHDATYAPHRVLSEGDVVSLGDVTLQTVETPGHAANHLCFALIQENSLFSGDHVMAWSTSVIAPPDGDMGAYLASLEKLRARPEAVYWPGHGGPVTDPARYLRALVGHRRQREAAVVARLEMAAATIPEIVASVYAALDPRLVGAASLSTRAHLLDLIGRGLVAVEGEGLTAIYRRI